MSILPSSPRIVSLLFFFEEIIVSLSQRPFFRSAGHSPFSPWASSRTSGHCWFRDEEKKNHLDISSTSISFEVLIGSGLIFRSALSFSVYKSMYFLHPKKTVHSRIQNLFKK